jgi:hypothetical protein
MDRSGQPEKTHSRGQAWFAGALLISTFAGISTGCSGWNKITGGGTAAPAVGDPLYGSDPAQKNPPAAAPSRSKSAALPAAPASNSSTSNVAMALGDPLPGSRPLAIEDVNKKPGGWQGPGAGSSSGAQLTGSVGVNLQKPEAIVDPVQRPTTLPVAGTAPAAPSAADLDQLQAQLKQRGMTWQHEESVAGGVRFTCAVPNRHNPDINRFYEATAPDLAAAIRAVLQQIDSQQNQ